MANFGEVLAELRQERRLTQRQLAEALHVSVGTISNYEKSVHYPDLEKLALLADYFSVTTDFLIGRCTNNISPDLFAEVIADGKTVGEIVAEIHRLPAERRKALVLILGDMTFSATVNKMNQRG